MKDKLPQLKRNPYALKGQEDRIYNNAGQEIGQARSIGSAVQRQQPAIGCARCRASQRAGRDQVHVPEPYSIYLHDTIPSCSAVTSGLTARLHPHLNPVEYDYLLRHETRSGNKDTIRPTASGKQWLSVTGEVPVTCCTGQLGSMTRFAQFFRDDIYQHDKPMVWALYQKGGRGGDACCLSIG